MYQSVNFCGASGQSYGFERMKTQNDEWISAPGVMIFTAADGRVIKVSEQSGRAEDISAIWRWREAQRFGATSMFLCRDKNASARRTAVDDLKRGLDPVCDMATPYETASESVRIVLPLAA